jgi:hypothetical protein
MLSEAVPSEDVTATARRSGVELHHVRDVCLACERGLGAMVIVEMEPSLALGVGAIDAHVCSFVDERAVEAFDFAVGVGVARLDAAVDDVAECVLKDRARV